MALAERVETTGLGTGGNFSVSPSGSLAYLTGGENQFELTWYDRSANQISSAFKRSDLMANLRLSPDGQRVAFNSGSDAWTYDLTRQIPTRLTFNGSYGNPVWSPDGTQVALSRGQEIYRRATNGTGSEETLWKDLTEVRVLDWSPDARYLLFTIARADAGRDLWLLPLEGDRKPVPLLRTQFEEDNGAFSPGPGAPRWIAYQSSESGKVEVYVTAMPGAQSGKWQISTKGGLRPRWRKDGRELFYLLPDLRTIMAVDIESGPTIRPGVPRVIATLPNTVQSFDVTPDGKKFLISSNGGDSPASAITVVLNWHTLLKK